MGFARTKADPDALIAALHESGQAALGLGQFESARKDFDEELEVNRRNQSANPIGEATALDDLAELSNATWDYEEALKTLGKSQALCDQKSDDGRVLNARILQDRGEAEIGIGEFEKAEEPIQTALKTFTSEGDQRETLTTQDELARFGAACAKDGGRKGSFHLCSRAEESSPGRKTPRYRRKPGIARLLSLCRRRLRGR